MSTLKLITTHKDYLLLVDESKVYGKTYINGKLDKTLPEIVAHLPLNNAPVLEGVLLLPELSKQEDGIAANMAANMAAAIRQTLKQYWAGDAPREKDEYEVSFLYPADNRAYQMLLTSLREYDNSAKTKRWSDEDIWKAYNSGMFDAVHDRGFNHNLLQSLSPKPIGFEPELQASVDGHTWFDFTHNPYAVIQSTRYKTVQTEAGEVLQGRYLYET